MDRTLARRYVRARALRSPTNALPVLRFCVGQEKQMQLLKARVLLFEAFVTEAMASQTTQDFVWIIYARTR